MSTAPVPKRAIAQIRPKGTDGPLYSPQRDLAYIFGPALGEALAFLSPNVLDNYHRDLMEQRGMTVEGLCEAISAFMQAIDMFTGEPKGIRYATPQAALEAAGFYKAQPLAQMFVYEKLGAVLTGGFFVAVRDVTPYYDAPPPEVGMANMLAAGRELCRQMSGRDGVLLVPEAEQLLAQVVQMRKSADLRNEELKHLRLSYADMRKNCTQALDAQKRTLAELAAWQGRSWWRRLFNLPPKAT